MRIVILYASLLFLSACGETPVLEKHMELPDVWTYDQAFDFPIDVAETDSKYRLEFVLTHADDYDFQNIYTRIKTEFPNGKSAIDTVSIQLSDKFGRWFGACSSGACEYRVVLKDSFNFVEPGKHRLNLEQYSRTDYLEGVNELGFALYKY